MKARKKRFYLFSENFQFFSGFDNDKHQLKTSNKKLDAESFFFRSNAVVIKDFINSRTPSAKFKIIKL